MYLFEHPGLPFSPYGSLFGPASGDIDAIDGIGKDAGERFAAVGNGKVGEDGKRIKLEIKKGDRILFGKYSGTEVKVSGEEYLIMREDDVLGIID